MTSTALQTPLERSSKHLPLPSGADAPKAEASVDEGSPHCLVAPLPRCLFDIAGVRIFASRGGDRVTGRVEFPYAAYGKKSVPIDYRSSRPNPSRDREGAGSKPCNPRARARLDLVNQWMEGCEKFPALTRIDVAKEVCKTAAIKCSPRSLQIWAQKFRLESEIGLIENYTPRPRKTLTLSGELAAQAVQVCAWWAFRIGNVDVIDSKM